MRKFTLNKLCLVILMLMFSSKLFSQTYQPFPEQQATWIVKMTYYSDPSIGVVSSYSFNKYEVNSDTTIGIYTYKKVMGASIGLVYSFPLPPYGQRTFRFAYRNDSLNKKVFIYANFAGIYKDSLWYDFNLNIGDTLKDSYAIDVDNYGNPDYVRVIVTSIDSVFICGEYHKRFEFGSHNCYNSTLIEGIGFVDNFVQSIPHCPFEEGHTDETQFSCTVTSLEESIASINQIELFPNPVINTLQINHSNEKMIFPLEYSVVDCLGRKVANGISTDDKGIDVSELKTGLYLLKLQDKEGKLFQSKFLKQ